MIPEKNLFKSDGIIKPDYIDAYTKTESDTDFVKKESGKSLIADTEITRLSNIESNAQVNVIETVKVDNTALTVSDKTVNIDLSGKVDKKKFLGVKVPVPANPFGVGLYDFGETYKIIGGYDDFIKTINTDLDYSTYYVNPVTGDNSNDGTFEAPLLTVAAATAKQGDNIKVILPNGIFYCGQTSGVFTEIIDTGKNVFITCEDGTHTQKPGVYANTRTWVSVGNGVYSNSLTATVFSVEIPDGDIYRKVDSLSDVENTPNSWFKDDKVLYVKTLTGIQPSNEFLVTTRNSIFRGESDCDFLRIENIKIPSAEVTFGSVSDVSKNFNFIIKDIEALMTVKRGKSTLAIKNSITSHFRTTEDCNILIEGCVCVNASKDGISYHGAVDGDGFAIEIDCQVYNSGIDQSDFRNNCSTCHENWTLMRIGGDYRVSRCRPIHDVNFAKSYNYFLTVGDGIIVDGHEDESIDFACGTSIDDINGAMYLYKCITLGSDSTLNIGNYNGSTSPIYIYGTEYKTKSGNVVKWYPFKDAIY